jgi:hypothetical protein
MEELQMASDAPIACALGAGELEQRLATIAGVGAGGLISRESVDDGHLLGFRASAGMRMQLEQIIAAEAKCCSFLDLSLSEECDQLRLSIAAPEDARAVADELAGAFDGTSR